MVVVRPRNVRSSQVGKDSRRSEAGSQKLRDCKSLASALVQCSDDVGGAPWRAGELLSTVETYGVLVGICLGETDTTISVGKWENGKREARVQRGRKAGRTKRGEGDGGKQLY